MRKLFDFLKTPDQLRDEADIARIERYHRALGALGSVATERELRRQVLIAESPNIIDATHLFAAEAPSQQIILEPVAPNSHVRIIRDNTQNIIFDQEIS